MTAAAETPEGVLDASRLASVISPLRRVLLASARAAEHLPEIPDAQVEVIRALPRGVVSSPGELAEIAASYKRAAGFHPDILNARPSLTPEQTR